MGIHDLDLLLVVHHIFPEDDVLLEGVIDEPRLLRRVRNRLHIPERKDRKKRHIERGFF